MSDQATGVRERGFADFSTTPPEALGGHNHWLMRGQNFWLEWVELSGSAGSFHVESEDELLLIAHGGALRTDASAGTRPAVQVPGHSVAILPPGRYGIAGEPSARCVVLASHRPDVAGRRVLQAQAYERLDPRIAPTGKPYRRKSTSGTIQVLDIAQVMASKDKPRLKMLQTETLSINIVEYAGPRNRAELSPHSHATFEQGSLAIAGDFVHHLRVTWGSDADQWREDEHLLAPSPSLLVVPVDMIHTTEGVGEGHHFLVDLFSPPRADFIGKGWVANAADYEPANAVNPA
jgi:hypothetical protein